MPLHTLDKIFSKILSRSFSKEFLNHCPDVVGSDREKCSVLIYQRKSSGLNRIKLIEDQLDCIYVEAEPQEIDSAR